MEDQKYDIVIAGAGSSGLFAAYELSKLGKKIAIVEARERAGGRIQTIHDSNYLIPVEAGAEFIHGNLDITMQLLKDAGISYYEVKGDIWQKENQGMDKHEDFIEDMDDLERKFKEVKEDMPVSEFISKHLYAGKHADLRISLGNYVGGYYAADLTKASTLALCKELTTAEDTDYRLEGGYGRMISFLEKECKNNGVTFFFGRSISQITWIKNEVHVHAKEFKIHAQKLICTLPVGVLTSSDLFNPSLPEKSAALAQLGFGPVVKIIMSFDEIFWYDKKISKDRDLHKMSFMFSEEFIPTWWTQYPKELPMLTGWAAGPAAEKIKSWTDEKILEESIRALASIFKIDKRELNRKLVAGRVFNWVKDRYSLGGYSYEVVNGKTCQAIVKQPVEDTLYFSGEGLYEGSEIGTVEAALRTAREAVEQILKNG